MYDLIKDGYSFSTEYDIALNKFGIEYEKVTIRFNDGIYKNILDFLI